MSPVTHHVPPILDLLTERQTTVNTRIEALRERISQLTDELAEAEAEATRLGITRDTLTGLADQPRGQAPAETEDVGADYQTILGAFDTNSQLRAKQLCQLLDLGTSTADIKRTRSRLKRLVARRVLAEPEQGLFTLATRTRG
jgi:hypothetical protein